MSRPALAETGNADLFGDCVFDVCMGAGEAQGTLRWDTYPWDPSGRVTPKDLKISKHLMISQSSQFESFCVKATGNPKLTLIFIHLHTHLIFSYLFCDWNFHLTSTTLALAATFCIFLCWFQHQLARDLSARDSSR